MRYIELHLERTRAWSPPGPKEVERLKARLDESPKDAPARARLAEGMLSARQYDEAESHAERAVRDSKSPGPARALVVLGLVAKMRDRDDEAARARFAKAVEADADDFLARLYLGLAERATGGDSAVRTLEEAHEMNPRFAQPVRAFGAPPLAELLVGLLRDEGKGERARAAAQRASRADPSDWKSALFAGEAHLAAGRPADAKEWLARALSVNPFDASTQLAFGRASMELAESRRGEARAAELDHAARAYRAAAALAERDPAGHVGLVRALAALGRGEEARAALETLRQFDPRAAGELERELAKALD
jgi:tetratricopeptide (TPR) repeat protein